MNFVKVISTELDNLQRRVVKILRYGKSDVQTSDQIAPHGIDSNPVKDMIAVYAETGQKGETIIAGYLNRNVLAAAGETRIYSTNTNGELQIYAWLKADGTMELGGNAKHLARFEELKSGFDTLKTDLNDLKTKWNTFATAYIPGGPAVVGTPPTAQTSAASTASIDSAKIDEIKTL
jgi:hypothetical protein